MTDLETVYLTHGKEEVAFHEAGHAAVELIAGFTPQLVLIRDAGDQWVGDCYSCAPTDKAQNGWRARKAVAGALSQAKHVAERRLGVAATLDLGTCGHGLVAFFLTPPQTGVGYRAVWRGGPAGQSVEVDLAGGYSGQDFLHFRVAVSELADVSFDADDPACQAAAREAVTRCVACLDDRFVWRQVEQFAAALLDSAPVTLQMVNRDEIEAAAGLLFDYRPREPAGEG